MALKRMGFNGQLVSHGLRALASTTVKIPAASCLALARLSLRESGVLRAVTITVIDQMTILLA